MRRACTKCKKKHIPLHKDDSGTPSVFWQVLVRVHQHHDNPFAAPGKETRMRRSNLKFNVKVRGHKFVFHCLFLTHQNTMLVVCRWVTPSESITIMPFHCLSPSHHDVHQLDQSKQFPWSGLLTIQHPSESTKQQHRSISISTMANGPNCSSSSSRSRSYSVYSIRLPRIFVSLT
jgi:hypothetical protein